MMICLFEFKSQSYVNYKITNPFLVYRFDTSFLIELSVIIAFISDGLANFVKPI